MIRSQAHNTVHLYCESFVDFHNLQDLPLVMSFYTVVAICDGCHA